MYITKKWTGIALMIVSLLNLGISYAENNNTANYSKIYIDKINDIKSTKPKDGYLIDYQYEGIWRKAIKFPTGRLDYFDNYDMVIEGVTYQNPERIDRENMILVPANEDIAWNSKIGVYGSNGTAPSETIYLEGTEIRPFGGKIDNSSKTTQVIFEEGNVTRYENYEAIISGKKYTNLQKDAEKNSIDLTTKVADSASIILSGLNDRGQPITVFEKKEDPTPLQGFVIFHGNTSTCIMFREGDLTKYAAGYRLYYEDTSTTESINLEPIHIRFESVGKNIRSEVRLVALDEKGQEIETLFQGRFNDQ